MPDKIWNAVQSFTSEIVRTPSFQMIVDCVPYFENWWHSELAWRFNVRGPTCGHSFAGFDVPALPKHISGTGIQPDLFLDSYSAETGVVDRIVWLQLKQLNLQRRVDLRDEAMTATIKRSLANSCKAFCNDLVSVQNIDLAKTAEQRFLNSRDLQQQTLRSIYRERPLETFRNAKHFAASFMLAAVPTAWSDEFTSCLKRSVARLPTHSALVFQETKVIHEWKSERGEVRTYLSGLASEFS